MQSDKIITDYISQVCQQIKWQKAVPEIQEELQDHILCQKDRLVAEGLDEAEAIDRAIAQTGDAAAIGKKLNRANRPPTRENPFAIAALRQPLRTVLLLLLIGLASFVFITNASEYIVTNNEISKIGSYYQTIGVLLPTDPAQLDVTQGATFLENSPYVAYTDWRRVASGILADITNADATLRIGHDGAYTGEAMFYGTVTEILSFHYEPIYSSYVNESYAWDSDNGIGTCYEIKVLIDTVTIGQPEFVKEGETVSIRVDQRNLYTHQLTEDISWVKDLRVGERYFLRAYRNGSSYYTNEQVLAGETDAGSKQIRDASGSIEPNLYLTFRPVVDGRTYVPAPVQTSINEEYFHWFDQVPDDQGLNPVIINAIPVPPGQSLNFDDPALSGLKQEIELTRRNQSALLLISTKDMAALPNRWENISGIKLKEGRWLNLEDHEQARPVCVINGNFALFRGLAIGDTLTVDMEDYYFAEMINSYTTLYRGYDGEIYDWHPGTLRRQYVPYVRELERYDWQQPEAQHQIELEIVGTYSMPDAYNSRERNVVYIPDSVMPADFGGSSLAATEKGMFSYVLNSYKDVNAFMQENRDALAGLGLSIVFLDNNAAGFWEIMEPLQSAKLIVIIACAVLLLLTLTLAVYLYLNQRRKEFAIMRALGTPLKLVRRQLLLPISVLGGAGIAIGGYAAWRHAMQQIAQVMAPLYRWGGDIPKFEPPSMLLLLALCVAIFLLMQLILHIGIIKISGQPVLEMLQAGNAAVRQKSVQSAASPTLGDTSREMAVASTKGSEQTADAQKGYKSLHSYLTSGWFVIRNIVRAPLKSALTVAVAMLFVLVLGWVNQLIARNEVEIERLYAITKVEAEITVDSVAATTESTIPKELIDAIRDSGYVIGTNVQHARWWRLTTGLGTVDLIQLQAIDNANALTGAWRNTDIEYAEGWDESLFAIDFAGSEPVPFDIHPDMQTQLANIQARLDQMLAGRIVPIAVSSDIQTRLGLELGDELPLRSFGGIDDNEVTVYDFNVVIAAVFSKNSTATIATGVADDGDITILLPYSMTELIPSYATIESVANLVESKNRFNTATFMIDPSRNRELASSTAALDKTVRNNTSGLIPMALRLWDEELRQVVEPMEYTLSLLDVLYPIIVTASVMIAAGLAVLMVLQSLKLVAILRVLGTTRARVIAMQSSEQVIVCLVGLVLGILATFIFLGATIALSSSSFMQAGLYLLGALIGSVFAARMATNRSPMDLLQVKE